MFLFKTISIVNPEKVFDKKKIGSSSKKKNKFCKSTCILIKLSQKDTNLRHILQNYGVNEKFITKLQKLRLLSQKYIFIIEVIIKL